MTSSRRVLLGVSGGIAAYKSAELVRVLGRRGFDVRCAVTRNATAFVAPLTLEVLSGRAVYQEEYLKASGSGEEVHIRAADWADALLIAPATAHALGKLALGLADDFLMTTALAFSGPVLVAPAMHTEMWGKEAVQRNVQILLSCGVRVLGPVEGPLASGETGVGRMVEPEEIAAALEAELAPGPLAGRTVLVTAGPTREPADPVRYLSNRSSGRMGFALAAAAAARGARSVLVAGPVDRETPAGVERVDVVTAREMRETVYRRAPEADLVIMAAAVCDFRPRRPRAHKVKKARGWDRLELEPNPDILAGLSALAPGALLVGFAAETENLEEEARRKLREKNVDFLVANDVSRSDVGFESDDNEVTVFRRDGTQVFLERQPKRLLADRLMTLFSEALERIEADSASIDR